MWHTMASWAPAVVPMDNLFTKQYLSCAVTTFPPQEFVWSTAEFVKRLAPRQLVTVGLEGFFGASTPGECDVD